MLKIIVVYLVTALVFFGIDMAWLAGIAKGHYQSALGPLIAETPNLRAAAIFYLLFPLGILIFASVPALAAGSWTQALWRGALFGFFTYMTYEFTNLALIRDWPSSLVALDIAWGIVLTGVATTAGYFAGKLVS